MPSSASGTGSYAPTPLKGKHGQKVGQARLHEEVKQITKKTSTPAALLHPRGVLSGAHPDDEGRPFNFSILKDLN